MRYAFLYGLFIFCFTGIFGGVGYTDVLVKFISFVYIIEKGDVMQKVVILKRKFPCVIYKTVEGDVNENTIKEILVQHNKSARDVIDIIKDGSQIVIAYWQYEYMSIIADDLQIEEIKERKAYAGWKILKIIDIKNEV